MGDRSAHNESWGPSPLVKTRLRRPRRWRKGMEVKEELGPAPGEEEAGRARQNVFFLCLVCSFFSLYSAVLGGRGREAPLSRRGGSWVAASGAGRGWDLGLSEKPTAVVRQRNCKYKIKTKKQTNPHHNHHLFVTYLPHFSSFFITSSFSSLSSIQVSLQHAKIPFPNPHHINTLPHGTSYLSGQASQEHSPTAT